jgi:hypothetical protein
MDTWNMKPIWMNITDVSVVCLPGIHILILMFNGLYLHNITFLYSPRRLQKFNQWMYTDAVGCEALTVGATKITMSWDVTPLSPIEAF